MRSIHIKAIFTALLTLSLLATIGCQAPETDEDPIRIDATPHANLVKQAKQDWSWIAGTAWMLKSIEGKSLVEETLIYIELKEHSWLIGSTSCNHISAAYERRGIDGLKFTNIAGTKMHCPNPAGIMQQESRFLHLLGNIDSYHAEPDKLTLSTNGVNMLYFERLHLNDF